MPIILAKRNDENLIDDTTYQHLIAALPAIVAEALNAPDDINGELTADEIAVWDTDTPIPHYGISHYDLELVVLSHNFPSRLANLDERREMIIQGTAKLLPKGTSFFVWILCMPTSWGQAIA